MKLLLPFLLLLVSCAQKPNTAKKDSPGITDISLICENTLSITNHYVSVTISKAFDSITVHSVSKPLIDSARWAYSKLDTTFTLDSVSFDQLVNMVTKITAKDVITASATQGDDGNDNSISYGHGLPSIAYSVWSPEVETEQRSAQQFLDCKNAILNISKIDFDRHPIKQ